IRSVLLKAPRRSCCLVGPRTVSASFPVLPVSNPSIVHLPGHVTGSMKFDASIHVDVGTAKIALHYCRNEELNGLAGHDLGIDSSAQNDDPSRSQLPGNLGSFANHQDFSS